MTHTPLLRLLLLLLALTGLYAASPAAAAERGLVTAVNQTMPEVETAHDLRAQWMRLFMRWDRVEPTDDSYAGNHVDSFRDRVRALEAKGIKVLIVVQSAPDWARSSLSPIGPPTDAREYAEFVAQMAVRLPEVDAWEIWNEADEDKFWENGPQPAQYTALLKATYPAVKAVQPQDVVVTAGMVANNFEFLEGIYAHGGRGSFDAVGVHTDTACLTAEPNFVYRDEQGRIGRYAFTGYRELHHIMAAHGDGDKQIWMTEIGWNTASTAENSCQDGGRAGTKPAGVSEAQQAEFLTAAYRCLATDPYVGVAFWFSTQDVDNSLRYDHRLGLIRADGTHKPAYSAFKGVGGTSPHFCGGIVDHVAPTVEVASPVTEMTFADRLSIKAVARDNAGGIGVRRIELLANGKRLRYYRGDVASLDPWYGSRELPLGRHTITVRAEDLAGNSRSVDIPVRKVTPDQLNRIATATELKLGKLRKRGRWTISAGGATTPLSSALHPFGGRTDVIFQKRTKARRGGRVRWIWKPMHRYSKDARESFSLVARLYGPGQWRAYARYRGAAPYAVSRSRYLRFRVRG